VSPAFCRSMGLVAPVTPSAVLHRDASTIPRVTPLPSPLSTYGNLRRQPFTIPTTPGSLPPFTLPSGSSAPPAGTTPTVSPDPSAAAAPSPAPASDPAWDSHQRTGFSYPLGLSPLLADRSALPTLRQGTT
jgi:hypothetical protein